MINNCLLPIESSFSEILPHGGKYLIRTQINVTSQVITTRYST